MDGLKISVPSVGHLKNLLLTLLLPIFLGNFNNLEGGIVERKAFNLSPSKVASGSFTSIPAEESGLEFINHYQDPRMWSSRYLPATAGATGTGLAVGDFDDDGWADIFAVSREGQNRLYKNLSGLRFEDVTDKAGIDPSLDWNSGVTSVDIDTDGDLDLYVCAYNSPNQFYINHGNGTFADQAFELGLDVWDASNAAYFADYDRDGDLDLYLQTNQLEEENNGEECLKALETVAYDIIFMDLQMPVMDGFRTTIRILNSETITHTPFITAFTANARQDDRDACQAVGMHDFVAKPARPHKIMEVITRGHAWLENRATTTKTANS